MFYQIVQVYHTAISTWLLHMAMQEYMNDGTKDWGNDLLSDSTSINLPEVLVILIEKNIIFCVKCY